MQTGERAEDVLIENDFMSEGELLQALSGVYQTHFVSTDKLAKVDIPRGTVQMIPRRVAETLGVFPVVFDRDKNVLSVVTADPDLKDVLRDITLVSGAQSVKAFVARPAAIAAAIRKHHGGDLRAFDLLERAGMTYNFGQQVLADGRVMGAKDTYRQSLGSMPDFGPPTQMPGPLVAPTPVAAPPPPAAPPPAVPVVAAPVLRPPPPLPASARGPRVPGNDDGLASPKPARRPRPAPSPPSRFPPSSPALPTRPPTTPVFDRGGPSASSASAGALRANTQIGTRPPLNDVARQTADQNETTIELLTVLVSLLESSRQELRGHSSQVARLLRRVAERMNLGRAETQALIIAGHIHDLGKMGQFHLTAMNCAEYEGHRVAALKVCDTPQRLLESVRLVKSVKSAVFHMYERVDGNGFPDKLVGKEIPLGARLLAVADSYADLTQNSRNPLRKVLTPAEAMTVLLKHKGTIFDPSTLDLFKSLVLGEDMKAKLLASHYRVLLVDADPEESTVLELRMVEQGFDVKMARSVAAARKLAASEGAEFDVVICELELPDADGLAFLAEARGESWGRDIPWVVHTQKQGRAEANRAFELGAMDFVAKPVQADVFVAKLKAMLDQRTTRRRAKGVSGSLRDMGLPDIVQVLFHGRKTGKLKVRFGGQSGEIHFLEGNVANALLGDLSGTSAFYSLLKVQDGEFELDPGFAPPKRVIVDSSEALLLEGMRRMDES